MSEAESMLPMLLLARGASEQLIRDFKALLASSILSKNEGKGTVVYKDALLLFPYFMLQKDTEQEYTGRVGFLLK